MKWYDLQRKSWLKCDPLSLQQQEKENEVISLNETQWFDHKYLFTFIASIYKEHVLT